MNNKLIVLLITLTTWTTLFAQDGSDILYGTVDKLDNSYLGDFIHLDFHNKSFRGASIDTITIDIDGKPMVFLERRKDNGYNNWFDKQFLESIKSYDDLFIRVVKSRLDKITADSVFVTNYLDYYHHDKLIPEKSRQIQSEFSRKIIAGVLVSADSHNRPR